MNKLFKRMISIVLAIVLLICSFSGCAGGVIEADANDYLTKGEWFNYFVEEIGLGYFENIDTVISLEKDSPYYESVYSIVDYGICSSDIACENLDECVTRDVVAYTCVNYLPKAYRKQIESHYKDESKITDIATATEAIEYGILDSSSKIKFNPDNYVTVDECQNAISVTMDYEANFEFDESECNTEIEYYDNVYNLNDEIVEVVSSNISEDSQSNESNFDISNMVSKNDASVTTLGLANDNNVIETATGSTDTISVKVERSIVEKNKSAYKVGNVIKFNQFDVYTNTSKTPVSVCYIEITKEPVLDKMLKYYIVTGELPANDEIIKSIKDSQKDTSKAIKCDSYEKEATGVTGFKFENNGVSFTYTKKGSTAKTKRTDPTYGGEYSVKVSVSDFSLTTSGLDSIFKDIVKDNKKDQVEATVQLSYNTTFKVVAQSDTVRFTPYNNGNGKFPSNLSRSRLTTGDGAKRIKICKLVVPVADTPLAFSFALYLNFAIDGKLTVTIERDNVRGVRIKGKQITPIRESDTKTTIKATVNLFAGIVFEATFGITGARTPILNFEAGLGFDLLINATGYLMNKDNKYTQKQNCPNINGDLLDDIVANRDGTDFNYCLDLNLSLQVYVTGVTTNCYVGKLLNFLNSKYSPPRKEWNIPLYSTHFEDGSFVSKCTRESHNEINNDEKTAGLTFGDSIDISEYNLIVKENMCGQFSVTQVPSSKKNMEKTANELKVYSTNKKVCNATYFPTSHVISVDPTGIGSCEVIIETKGGKHKMSCAIIVNSVEDVIFTPDLVSSKTEICYI